MIRAPFQLKPLEQVASKHRKRAIVRRSRWQEIADAACEVMMRRRVARQAAGRAAATLAGAGGDLSAKKKRYLR